MVAHPIRIGVDFGGTELEVIALTADGRELCRKRAPTPAGDYEGQIARVVTLVAELERAVGASGTIGVGIPGAISPATGLIKNANSTWLIGRPLDRDLARALGRPVRLQNDANCLAVSEATDGAAAGAEVVFAAILGTGVGAGIVVQGRPLTGRNAIAGEWGHNQLPWMRDDERPGPACYCRLHGCIETILSGPGLARDHREATGRTTTAEQIAGLAVQGDVEAEATLRRYEDRLARVSPMSSTSSIPTS
jgi:fructokinase